VEAPAAEEKQHAVLSQQLHTQRQHAGILYKHCVVLSQQPQLRSQRQDNYVAGVRFLKKQ
jgi:hypothetical protein